jgi:beta-glucosidase
VNSDLIGVNYYNGLMTSPFHQPPVMDAMANERKTAMGWAVRPDGLSDVLRSAAKLGVPVYVTENGIATDDDSWRIEFIRAHIERVVVALEAGIDVRGYLHWSWIDNFEWPEGFAPRFGLVGVDPTTLARRPKPSLDFYTSLIRDRQI